MDIVLMGKVKSEITRISENRSEPATYTFLRLEVIEVWKGAAGAEFDVVVPDGALVILGDRPWREDVIVAAWSSEAGGLTKYSRLPKLYRHPCGSGIVYAVPHLAEAWRDWRDTRNNTPVLRFPEGLREGAGAMRSVF